MDNSTLIRAYGNAASICIIDTPPYGAIERYLSSSSYLPRATESKALPALKKKVTNENKKQDEKISKCMYV